MRIRVLFPVLFLVSHVFAQVENKSIQQGNEKYKKSDYAGAESSYKEGIQKNASSQAGNYNLGNAFYQQQKYDDALKQYQQIAENTKDPSLRSDAYHNMGNVLLQQKQYEQSVDAYKNALKAKPDDADSKYNLAYAQAMLKKQQQQQNQDQNKQDQNKDKQDQHKKDEQKKKEDQEKKDKNKDEQNNNNTENQQKQEQQPQKKEFSKEEMERIMQALNNEDKKVQDKVNKQKTTSSKAEVEKDW